MRLEGVSRSSECMCREAEISPGGCVEAMQSLKKAVQFAE